MRRPVSLGSHRSTTPISDRWGVDRGTPADRYYIEQFLDANRKDITGRVLEVKDSAYVDRYGSGVTSTSVLDIDSANNQATIVADLGVLDSLPEAEFDCFVLTQTLHYVGDLDAAVANAFRTLRPGGVLLATVPAITRGSRPGEPIDYWRFTADGCTRLFVPQFGADAVSITPFGNVLVAIAFLTGMAYEELKERELAANDPRFPIVIGIRATRT
jgi:SAM-dependent methyltransferase